jgi:dienelactone hydrolase
VVELSGAGPQINIHRKSSFMTKPVTQVAQHALATAVAAIGLCCATSLQAQTGGQTPPPIGGGYTDVTTIPVNDPAVKAIGGALFKPAGAGPFPAVVYMTGCPGIDPPPLRAQQKTTIDRLLGKGVAILIVDSFTPRGEPNGVCANLGGGRFLQYGTRGSHDALAAVSVLQAMPEIDTKRIFLLGFSLGGYSSLLAMDAKNATNHNGAVAGVIAYYPFCFDGVDPSVPALVLIGEKDTWTPAAKCQAVTGKPNFQLVVYPDATHVFDQPSEKPREVFGHRLVYDAKAAHDAQQRVDTFIAAHMN